MCPHWIPRGGIGMKSRYIVTQPAGASYWEVLDDDERVCWRSGSKAKCAAVAEFLQDHLMTPSYEGTKAWITQHAAPAR